jgi:hypothetical protein
MRLFARGAATAVVAAVSFGASAADLNYPPPVQHGSTDDGRATSSHHRSGANGISAVQ